METRQGGKPRIDADGVKVSRETADVAAKRWIFVAAAVVLGSVVAVVLVVGQSGGVPAKAAQAGGPRSADVATAAIAQGAVTLPQARRVSDSRRGTVTKFVPHAGQAGVAIAASGFEPAAPPPGAPNPADGEIDAADYIAALHAKGQTEGLAAFPPPGTNPPRAGIVVPEEYQLPEGYVRHFQTTDDGQALEPILMYSPDYEFFDERGNPIVVPKDRVVPPELVPPGLPIRILDVPDRVPSRPGMP